MEYTTQEQDSALKTLSNLVKENQKLREELYKAQEFCMRLLLADNLNRDSDSFSFTDNALIDYQEDWEKILPYFFFQFYPNSNNNVILPEGVYKSKFEILIKNGTSFPKKGTIEEIRNKVLEISNRINSQFSLSSDD